MKLINKIYIIIGRAISILVTPFIWPLLSKQTRGYVFIEQDARVLLVKNWIGYGDWSLPGGGTQKNEKAILAAVREVREETNLNLAVDKIKFLKEGFNKRLVGSKHYALFHYNLPVGEMPIKHKFEIVDMIWVPLPSLRSTPHLAYEVIAALDARDGMT